VRTQLAATLQGVLSQQLLPTIAGGRALAMELLIPTPGIRAQIREDKLHMVYHSMQMGMEKVGMQTLTHSLFQLVSRKQITLETALNAANDVEELKALLTRSGLARFQT
jgi:twitching motility protein PilT